MLKRVVLSPVGLTVLWMQLVGVLLVTGCGRSAGKPGLEVTYIANEGFMVAMGGTTFLIDALPQSKYYANPSDTLAARMINGIPPYDNVDYFLVTHDHPDHFNPDMAARFLLHHPAARFIASSETCSKVKRDSVAGRELPGITLETGRHQTIRGEKAEIVVVRLSHGGNSIVSNLAYVVRSNGYTIVHVGDARICDNEQYLRALAWDSDGVDLLFMEYFDHGDDTKEIIQRLIKPKQVILMHIPPGEADAVMNDEIKVHPRTVVFRAEGETRSFAGNDID